MGIIKSYYVCLSSIYGIFTYIYHKILWDMDWTFVCLRCWKCVSVSYFEPYSWMKWRGANLSFKGWHSLIAFPTTMFTTAWFWGERMKQHLIRLIQRIWYKSVNHGFESKKILISKNNIMFVALNSLNLWKTRPKKNLWVKCEQYLFRRQNSSWTINTLHLGVPCILEKLAVGKTNELNITHMLHGDSNIYPTFGLNLW